MMKTREELVNYFRSRGGIVKFRTLKKAGFHHETIRRTLEEGSVEKIKAGLYKLADYSPPVHPDLVVASLAAPRGVICLISALYFHEATTDIPRYVEIALPKGSRAEKIEYPPVKFYRFSRETWEAGIETHDIEGRNVRIYGLAKTVADCFKFRNKIGIDTAREALKIAVNEKRIRPDDIMSYAKICRVDKIIKPVLEVII